jgi:short-subunit dehydrogenase
VATEFDAVANSDRRNLLRSGAADAVSVARHGYQAMMAGKVVAVPGLKNKLTTLLLRLGPRSAVRTVITWMNKKPNKKPNEKP